MRSQQHLELSQKQNLALNQLQYQSLRLLQCSATELVVEINKAIADNPLLEKVEIADFDNQSKLDRYWSDLASKQPIDDIPESPNTTSLTNYLFEQLRLLKLEPIIKQLVLLLISELDENAYLDQDINYLALSESMGLSATLEQWNKALDILQSFDPIGIGAHNLAESLRLQLLKQEHDVSHEVYECALAMTLYLPDAAAGKWQKLAKTLNVNRLVLEQAYKLIQQLNPYPASDWDEQAINYIIPDVLIYFAKNNWHVSVNPALGSNVRINTALFGDIKQLTVSPEFNEKVIQAKNLLRNLQQRSQTILLVSQFLANYQTQFLKNGLPFLLPLKLADVAQELGLHISTISRATRLKFAQTPLGLVALKDFFTYELNMGQKIYSPQAIQKEIAVLVGREDKNKPLSDMDICKLLQDQGINVARRTISKYREKLGLTSSYKRKLNS